MLALANQQATASWFAGILEGEGNFEHRNNSLRVEIANTDSDIIKACEDFLTRNHILFHTCFNNKKTKGGKTIYKIHVSTHDCKNLYNLIGSKVEGRRPEFQKLVGASETSCGASLDKDWLIGIWQAEGSFSMSMNNRDQIRVNVKIVNTNQWLIQKVVLNLKALNCAWHSRTTVPTVNKPYTIVEIGGMKRCQRFLIATENCWLSTRDKLRASLMLTYINSRLSKEQKSPYSEHEMNLFYQMKQLNV